MLIWFFCIAIKIVTLLCFYHYKEKECSKKRAFNKATFTSKSKQGLISAFAEWIKETGQKPDREGGHWSRSWSTLLVTGILSFLIKRRRGDKDDEEKSECGQLPVFRVYLYTDPVYWSLYRSVYRPCILIRHWLDIDRRNHRKLPIREACS